MASRQIEAITESSVYKLATPVILAVSGFFGVHAFNGVEEQQRTANQRMERLEGLMNDTKTDRATMDLRLKYVEVQVDQHASALGRLNDRVLTHEQLLQALQRPKGRP